MIVPSQRRPNRLDAELDALVAREVDALAQRKPRAADERATHAETAAGDPESEALPQDHEARHENTSARHSPLPSARGSGSKPAGTNVIGIRHGSMPSGLYGIPFSADEEAFVETSVAFLRQRPNADVIIEEIWTHAVLSRDQDVDHGLAAEALETEDPVSDAAETDEESLDVGAAAPESDLDQLPENGGEEKSPPVRGVPSRPKKRPGEESPDR
jgi:hypothetical protein